MDGEDPLNLGAEPVHRIHQPMRFIGLRVHGYLLAPSERLSVVGVVMGDGGAFLNHSSEVLLGVRVLRHSESTDLCHAAAAVVHSDDYPQLVLGYAPLGLKLARPGDIDERLINVHVAGKLGKIRDSLQFLYLPSP